MRARIRSLPMDHEFPSGLLEDALLVWRTARAWAVRVPLKAWGVLAVFLMAAFLMAVHTAFSAKTAALNLKVQHGLHSVQISVWVDGNLAYAGQITGSLHKRFGLIPESLQRNWSQRVPVAPGRHLIRVRIASDDASVQEDEIGGEFVRNGERDLAVSARRGSLLLSWQTSSHGVADGTSGSMLGRYASTLFLTLLGSIASAMTGYAIKELPKLIRSRQDVPAKP